MDWIRENKPLAVIFGIILAASLALGYLLFDAWGKYGESKESYLALSSEVAGLKGARISPTPQNLAEKQALVSEFATTVNQLGKALVSLQPEVTPIKNIEFQAKLKAKVAEVRSAATLARLGLPADFAFGFDEYTSNLPSEAASPELSNYLDAVDALVKLMMSSGVLSVDSLTRGKLAVEGGAAPAPTNARPGFGQQQQQQAGSNILERRQITTTLTLDQAALQVLLSRLSTTEMPYFTSLRLLRIENERQEGPARGGSVGEKPGGGLEPAPGVPSAPGAPGAEAATNEIKPPPPAPLDSVALIGTEKLKVYMEIDLIKFLPSAGGVAQAAPGMPQPQR